ncbi:MAG: hypothetical protein AAF224_11530 [Pseudomonadota bacterium]
MIWLAAQIWTYLVAAFALGLALGWFLRTTHRNEQTLITDGALAQASDADELSMREPLLHMSAPTDAVDDLTQIIGLDTETAKRLNALGVYHFQQIAAWDEANIRWIEYRLDDPGRIDRERWPEQAASLRETR